MSVFIRVFLFSFVLALGMAALAMAVGRSLPRGDQLLLEQIEAEASYLVLADVGRMLIVPLTDRALPAESQGVWSPDGNRIAYVLYDYRDNLQHACIMSLEAIEAPVCIPQRGRTDLLWSPQGTMLLYTSFESQTGTSLMVAHETGAPETIAVSTNVNGYDWSNDGRQVIYGAWNDNAFDLHVAFVTDENNNERLLDNGILPQFSHNGMWIGFVRRFASPIETDIFLVSSACIATPDTCNDQAFRLTEHESLIQQFVWSPDDMEIAYVSDHGDGTQIYIMNLSTRKSMLLTSGFYATHSPRYSPSRIAVAFFGTVSANYFRYDLYVQRLTDQNAPVCITCGEIFTNGLPQWRPR